MTRRLTENQHNSRVITYTLAFVIVAIVLAMLVGLYVERVDNKSLFAILGPAFGSIIGYFIGRGDRKD